MADNYIRHHPNAWIAKRVAALRGKKRTLEQKKKMSKAQKIRFQTMPPSRTFGRVPSEEERKCISTGLMGHFTSAETRAKISKSLMGHPGPNKGGHISEEQKEKLRKAAVKRIQRGGSNNERGRGGWFYSEKNQRRLHYRSHLERDWYMLLEKQTRVESYITEPISIPYIWNDNIHLYIPDLLICYTDGFSELIELKPEFAWDSPQNQAKWAAAKEWCERRGDQIRRFKVYGYNHLRRFK